MPDRRAAVLNGVKPARAGSLPARAGLEDYFLAGTGVAPGVPHLANLPLASLQTCLAAGAGHLVNLPFASLHGAAEAAVAKANTMKAVLKVLII